MEARQLAVREAIDGILALMIAGGFSVEMHIVNGTEIEAEAIAVSDCKLKILRFVCRHRDGCGDEQRLETVRQLASVTARELDRGFGRKRRRRNCR